MTTNILFRYFVLVEENCTQLSSLWVNASFMYDNMRINYPLLYYRQYLLTCKSKIILYNYTHIVEFNIESPSKIGLIFWVNIISCKLLNHLMAEEQVHSSNRCFECFFLFSFNTRTFVKFVQDNIPKIYLLVLHFEKFL